MESPQPAEIHLFADDALPAGVLCWGNHVPCRGDHRLVHRRPKEAPRGAGRGV